MFVQLKRPKDFTNNNFVMLKFSCYEIVKSDCLPNSMQYGLLLHNLIWTAFYCLFHLGSTAGSETQSGGFFLYKMKIMYRMVTYRTWINAVKLVPTPQSQKLKLWIISSFWDFVFRMVTFWSSLNLLEKLVKHLLFFNYRGWIV